MNGRPPWLPGVISTDGVWEQVLARLYAVFVRDFKQGKPSFQGLPVFWDRRILPGDTHEEGFWHLITKENAPGGDRLLDPPRAERLPWCSPTLQNSKNVEVKVWNYEEQHGRVRTYVWLENFDYLVILQQRKVGARQAAFLITAYHVGGDSTRRSLQRKYSNRI